MDLATCQGSTSTPLLTLCFLQVIKNPVSDHLPVGCLKIGTSFAASQVSDLRELVPAAEPVVIVVGAFAHGSVSVCVSLIWGCKKVSVLF